MTSPEHATITPDETAHDRARISYNASGHPVPYFSNQWPELDQLQWKAGHVYSEQGIDVGAYPIDYPDGTRQFGIRIERTSIAPMTLTAAWFYLCGVEMAAQHLSTKRVNLLAEENRQLRSERNGYEDAYDMLRDAVSAMNGKVTAAEQALHNI